MEHEADLKTQKRGVVTSLSYEFLQWCEEQRKPLSLSDIREWQAEYRKSRSKAPSNYYDQQSAASLKLQLEKAQKRAEKIAAALSRKAPEPTPIAAKRRGRPPKVRV